MGKKPQTSLMQSWVSNGLGRTEGETDKKLNNYHFDEHVLPASQRKKSARDLKRRNFNKNSYNGPRVEDFLRRLDALYQTAITEIDNSDFDDNQKEIRKKNLIRAKAWAENKLKENCKINIEVHSIDDIKKNEKYIIKRINKAARYLQSYVAHALPVVYPEESLDNAITAFQTAESEWTAMQGRPDFINTYQLGDSTRVSAQRVIGDRIIPSTKRDEGKLPNFVEIAVGSIDDKGNSEIEFTGYRHSSYPPINIKDKIERRAKACDAVKDMLTEVARSKQEQSENQNVGFDEEHPLEIELSSMALLSPIQGDKLFMDSHSEHRQLKESQYAQMMYNQRTIQLEVDGKIIHVKPKINLMNEPANSHGIIYKNLSGQLGQSSDLDKTINTKGMHDFTSDANAHIKTQIFAMYSQLNDNTAHAIAEGYIKINNVYESDKGLQIAQAELDWLLKNNELSDAYKQLETLQNKCLKENSTDDDKEAYYKQVDKVREIEHKRHKAYEKVAVERKRVWKQNKKDIADLDNRIAEYLKNPNNQDNKFVKKLFQMMQLYNQAEAIHHSKKGEPHEFASRYLLVNQFMGKSVDWFCKSGEDRTGRLNNFIEELCGFSAEHGHFPCYDFNNDRVNKADRAEQQEMAKTVVEYSVSGDICDANAHGARGIQQTDALGMKVNAGLPNDSWIKIAHLAKSSLYDSKLLKNAKKIKLEPTNTVNEQVKQSVTNSKAPYKKWKQIFTAAKDKAIAKPARKEADSAHRTRTSTFTSRQP